MAMEKREIIILLILAFGINIMLIEFAKLGIGVTCPNVVTTYSLQNETIPSGGYNYSYNFGFKDIISMATGRCEGLPVYIVLIFELPLLVALFISIKESVSPLS